MFLGRIVSFYLIRAVIPYFALSWLILSVILFVQQAGRYSDIFFDPNLPTSFVWQLSFALVPSVIAFTCPMAVLVGVIIGLSRMRADNELVAIQNIGIGNLAAVIPVLVLGIVLSLFSIAINIFGVPAASKAVRMVAMRSALYKLESPIEPGVFNTEIAGFTVYVRGVDWETGRWKNVFVYNEDAGAGVSRLITSRRGRIDSDGQSSELVLEDAVVTTVGLTIDTDKLVSENLGELRLAIKTRRDELATRLSDATVTAEEMGLFELAKISAEKQGREALEAKIIIVRRVVLSFAPILFTLLGAFMVLGISRSGRGFGIFLALATLLVYFLLTFAGEQLARGGAVPIVVGGLLAPAATMAAIIFFAFGRNRRLGMGRFASFVRFFSNAISRLSFRRKREALIDLTTGIRDLEIVVSLLRIYISSVVFLALVFMIFTAFELWRYAGSFEGGAVALIKYLFYLFPFTYLQIAPTAAMIAVLTVYTMKSRENELVIWISAGQSLYRLILPCLVLMLFLGGISFVLNEGVATVANRRQEDLRRMIRNRGVEQKTEQKLWIANDRTIVSFKNNTPASDNDTRPIADCSLRCSITDITIYQFLADKAELQSVYRISSGVWDSGTLSVEGDSYQYAKDESGFSKNKVESAALKFPLSTFSGTRLRSNQLSLWELNASIGNADSVVEVRALEVERQKRFARLFLPFAIALLTAPFAMTLGRRGRVISIAAGVGLWLVFVAAISFFEQLGLSGTLPTSIAVWGPLAAFSMLGLFLISRVRT
jgi:lipopolysaccharide export LptBFGC system permease protein LptF